MTRLRSFRDFWPVYLRAHADPRCRALHYAASASGLSGAVLAVLQGDWIWALYGMLGAYGFAWAGHFFVEKNVPLTFKHPLWSLAADFRMFGLWLAGQLPRHLRAAGAESS